MSCLYCGGDACGSSGGGPGGCDATRIVDGVEFFGTPTRGSQCARCGSSTTYVEDMSIDGTGWTGHVSLSDPEWCEAHPMPGRESERGAR